MNRVHAEAQGQGDLKIGRWLGVFLISLCVCISAAISGCSSPPTELRSLVPADTLIYLETNDLATALEPVINSPAFTKAARKKPDLSAIKGVQVAVAVTGFESKEEKLTDENSVAHIRPHFVAVADTHAWNFQARHFAEEKLGAFVADIYDDKPAVESSDRESGQFIKWTAKDGRKAFAFVVGSLIFFGNDESVIDKCLAVKKGEAPSMAAAGKNSPAATGEALASGYVTSDGIAQIASLIGLKLASESSEEPTVQGSIASIFPQVIRSWAVDASWTMTSTKVGVEDKFDVTLKPDIAKVFSESMVADDKVEKPLLSFAPADEESVTQYNFRNAQVAWRSLILTAQQSIDPSYARLLPTFANALFEPYGCKDGELFLRSIEPGIVTVRGADEDAAAVIVKQRDKDKAAKAMDPEFLKKPGTSFDASGVEFDGVRISGEPAQVLKCGQSERNGNNLSKDPRFDDVPGGAPSIRTLMHDRETPAAVAEYLSERIADARPAAQVFTETRFTKRGLERKTVSDLGFLGWIIAQLAAE